MAVPEANLIDVPKDMDPALAALTEPAATALHALRLALRALERPIFEVDTLVLGGGSVGLLSALWLRAYGCHAVPLAETNPLRRASAARTGACVVFDPIRDASPTEGSVDLVVDAVGNGATRKVAFTAVRTGGVVLHVGLGDNNGGTDLRKLTLAELTLIGSYTYTPVDLRASMQALHRGSLGDLEWVERRPLSAGAELGSRWLRGNATILNCCSERQRESSRAKYRALACDRQLPSVALKHPLLGCVLCLPVSELSEASVDPAGGELFLEGILLEAHVLRGAQG